jgi:hypothetical protein
MKGSWRNRLVSDDIEITQSERTIGQSTDEESAESRHKGIDNAKA